MARLKRFLYSHRVFFGLFFFLLAYEALVGNNLAPWRVNDHFITFYTVDFGLGFCSRFLPGAIYRFIFRNTELKTASLFAGVLLIFCFIIICFLFEKLVLHVQKEHRLLCLFFVLIFLTGVAGVSLYVRWLGVLDFYWFFFTALFFVFIGSRRLYFLIPPLFVLCVFVHYGAMVCYIPMMGIICLYKASMISDQKEKRYLLLIFALSVVSAFAATLCFLLFDQKNLIYPVTRFNEILLERGANYTYYYDYDLYGVAVDKSGLIKPIYPDTGLPFLQRLFEHLRIQIQSTFNAGFKSGSMQELALGGISLLPVLAAVFTALGGRLLDRERKNGLRTFSIALIPLLLILTFLFGTFFSTDTFRWLSHTVQPVLAAFLFICYHEGDRLFADLKCRFSFVPQPVPALFLLLFAILTPST